MAQIKEFSGADLNTISRFGGVSNTLEKINGVTVVAVASFTGLLDTYSGADFAFSVRLLRSAYTGAAMRVMRNTGGTGDADEADIGFVNNVISLDSAISNASAGVTATTLGQFINVGTVGGTTYTNPDSLTVTAECEVVKFYDQSTSGYDITAAANTTQLYIHDGTADTDLEKENGHPIARNDGDATPVYSNSSYTSGTSNSIFNAIRHDGTGDGILLYDGQVLLQATSGSTSDASYGYGTLTYYRDGAEWESSAPTRGDAYTSLYQDLRLITILYGDPSSTILRLGRAGTAAAYGFHEIVNYPNQTVSRDGVESNQNIYFQIGNFGTPTSGLLATYTGAAAAYSVRQLANTAALAMRVREDGTDTETDIGFDSNGDLDTAAISSHCGLNNGYVVTWYDQSGNANNATQSTTTSQPQIYNGTAVITENGKPCVQFDGSNDSLLYSTSSSTVNAFVVQTSTDTAAILFSSRNTNVRWHFILQDGNSSTDTSDWNNLTGDYGYKNGTLVATQGTTTRDQLHTALADGNQNLTSWVNLQNALAEDYYLGRYYNSGFEYSGKMQEIVLYNTDHTTNRTGIETNINGYFSIYT